MQQLDKLESPLDMMLGGGGENPSNPVSSRTGTTAYRHVAPSSDQ